ncbi:hypothetical protein KPL70_023617 [Citrus sinensis]|nr:hypothetical protein KPL70_023617 [Citrus sinensis]
MTWKFDLWCIDMANYVLEESTKSINLFSLYLGLFLKVSNHILFNFNYNQFGAVIQLAPTNQFINVTRWKIAICGEYMKSILKTCSCGMACNFIHCFRNPSGDYEWADWDKPPPRYWVKKMAALFGYSDESGTWNQEREGQTRNKIDSTNADRHHYRRSRSREADRVKSGSGRSHDDERQVHETTWSRRRSNYHSESRSDEANSDGSWSDRDRD